MTGAQGADTVRCCPFHPDAELIGVEVRGVYDGILYWVCGDCRTRLHRWPEGHRLNKATWAYWDKLDLAHIDGRDASDV